MFRVTLKLEDPGGVLSRLISLSGFSFTEEIWWGTQQRLQKIMKDKATSIKRYSVSKKTYQWRKAKAARGSTVETHIGERAPVLYSPRVGNRTGTLLNDIAYSLLPGVHEAISINEQGIKNGMYVYRIAEEAFHRRYPARFESYLAGRGIIDESLSEVDESQAQSLLDTLSNSVSNHLTALWYSNVS